MTSLRETGENILLPYPIRQLARGRKFAFAVAFTARVNVDVLQNNFVLCYTTIGTRNCSVNMRSVDLNCWEVSFSSTVNLFYTFLDRRDLSTRSDLSTRIAQHAALAASYCKLENHLVFYFNLLLIVYLLYSIKVTVFHRSLVCFYLVINFIITV